MYHVVARTLGQRPLWISDAEGAALWSRVLRACPDPVAVALMPDHVHVVHRLDVRVRLAAALSGHTRALGATGRLVAPLPDAEPIADEQKLRRQIRYVHLNPCRARLCADPLEWPFSTHRDATGLTVRPAVPVRTDPARFHAWVSADGTVDVAGTALPVEQGQRWTLEQVLAGVSAVTRTPVDAPLRRGPTRSLFLRAARTLTDVGARELARFAGVSHAAVLAHVPGAERDVRLVARVLGDPRFPALVGLRPWWRRRVEPLSRAP